MNKGTTLGTRKINIKQVCDRITQLAKDTKLKDAARQCKSSWDAKIYVYLS